MNFQTNAAITIAVSAIVYMYLGQTCAILAGAAVVYIIYSVSLPKPISTENNSRESEPEPEPVPEPEPEPVSGDPMNKFYDYVKSVIPGQGGDHPRSIVVAIAMLADHKGLCDYDSSNFEEGNVRTTALASFLRIKPSVATVSDIPGIGGVLQAKFAAAGHNSIESLLHKFLKLANCSVSSNKHLTKTLDDFFEWVASIHPGTHPNFHTVVHCTAALADEIDLIDLGDLGDNHDGDKYKESMSACTAETTRDFIEQFNSGRGELGPITDIRGLGPKAQKEFQKVNINSVEDLLDKFATFL